MYLLGLDTSVQPFSILYMDLVEGGILNFTNVHFANNNVKKGRALITKSKLSYLGIFDSVFENEIQGKKSNYFEIKSIERMNTNNVTFRNFTYELDVDVESFIMYFEQIVGVPLGVDSKVNNVTVENVEQGILVFGGMLDEEGEYGIDIFRFEGWTIKDISMTRPEQLITSK